MIRQQRSRGLIGRNPDPSPPPPEGERTLLTASDFTYEGSYTLATYLTHNGVDSFGEGLTHRYVSGTLRLLYTGFNGNESGWPYPHREVTVPNSFGANMPGVATYLNGWRGTWKDILCHKSLFYDQEENLLITGSGYDYPESGWLSNTRSLVTKTLPTTSGALDWQDCQNVSGWYGFQGIGQRALWGKVQRVPTWARTAYGLHKYISLSGGYTSLLNQGLGPALGPMFISFPALSGYTAEDLYYASGHSVPSTDFQICGDTRTGSNSGDWYDGGYAARTVERGARSTPVENYYDGGDPRSNPSTRPTDPPALTAEWLSSPTIASVPGDPDGWNRWVWGDSYNDSGNWIDNNAGTRNKHGIVMVATLAAGKAWYMTSALHQDSQAFEIHIYDPANVAAVKNGSLDAYKLRPTSIKVITADLGTTGRSASATFDPVTNKLFIAVYGQDEGAVSARVYQYAVAA